VTGVTPYLEWLLPGQRWLAENWTEGQAWDEVQPGFLAALGTDLGGLNSPDMRLLQLVDLNAAQLGEQARETLTSEAEFAEIVQRQYEVWSQEQELTAAAAPADASGYAAETDPAQAQTVEPTYVEGRGWMSFDQASGEWVDMPGAGEAEPVAAEPAGAEAAFAPAEATPAAEPTYVEGRGWMNYDAAAGEWVDMPAPPGTPETPADGEQTEPIGETGRPEQSVAEPVNQPVNEPGAAPAAETDPEPASTANADPTSSSNAAEQEEVGEPAAEPLPDLEPAAAEAVDTAVMEEIAPVVEEAFEGVEDLDLFSPEELQDILAAALEESGLSE
jgi:hypothetical protein